MSAVVRRIMQRGRLCQADAVDQDQAQEERDALTDAELLATTNLLLLAGHETTTNLIGNGTLALLREPDQWRRLCADPALLPTAIEELLRFDGPVQATLRVALEDVEIDGHAIPAGALVLVSIGAANHDPAVFEAPEQLDLARDPNPHLAFGQGVHYCLGANLARLEIRVFFEELIRLFAGFEPAGPHTWTRDNRLFGLKSLPVRATPR